MNKPCFKKGCTRQSAFTCECKKGVYFCKKHMGDHMLLQKTHNIESLYVILDQEDEKRMKKKTSELLSVYSELQKKAENYCKTIIDSLISFSNKLINDIASYSSAVTRIHSCILRSVPIDNEDLKLIEDIALCGETTNNFDHSGVIKLLELEFQHQSQKIFNKSLQDEFAFYQVQNDLNSLCCIDTKTLKLQRKRFNFGSGFNIGSLAQYKPNIYYLAMINYNAFNTTSGSSYNFSIKKIDFNSDNIENVYNSSGLNGGPLIHYDNCLYMFSCAQNTYRFDIVNGTWGNLGNLPENLSYISASNYFGTIFITGFNSGKIYKFNPLANSFSNSIVFDKGTYRYLFDNWLISVNEGLYEIQGSTIVKHQMVKNLTNVLKIFSSFRQKIFIYFIDSNLKLYRINTEKKIVELVNYT